MLPIQEIEISTKHNRVFSVHLEKWADTHFECKLAAINLGPQLPAGATFGPFTKGITAHAAYQALVGGLVSALKKLDPQDSIGTVNNPCNAEFITAEDQRQILGQGVVVMVNGVNS